MLRVTWFKHILKFRQPAQTSRNTLLEKPGWLLAISDSSKKITGWGECSIIPGLSPDNPEKIEPKLDEIVNKIQKQQTLKINIDPDEFPAVRFGLETAIIDFQNGGIKKIFGNDFFHGTMKIPINGLVWMGDFDFMKKQVKDKLYAGFDCIKMKIGAFDFEDEYRFLKNIRKEFGAAIKELRLDANGAFTPDNALERLKRLSELGIHSIEQPILAGQWEAMAEICNNSPVPVALDEELIGLNNRDEQLQMLEMIRPDYIVLKPSLTGGLASSDNWIRMAEKIGIGWWATSALESNIGLNAIAQWVAQYRPALPQGLGTGSLYQNNFNSPLAVSDGCIRYNPSVKWQEFG